MRQMRMVAVLALGAMAVGWSGCTQGVNEAPLLPEVNSPVADVPIPADFYMTSESRSSVTTASGVRLVEHYYKGKGGLLPVVRFYREQLPAKGWAITSQQQVGDKFTLNCSKANEDLAITVWDGTFDTHIEARIYPADRTPATPPK